MARACCYGMPSPFPVFDPSFLFLYNESVIQADFFVVGLNVCYFLIERKILDPGSLHGRAGKPGMTTGGG